jgi:pimeloyl-ACP methyl ester carboxylesterase
MRKLRGSPCTLALWISLALAWPARAHAEEEKVKFDTVDGVELHGTYYPSAKSKKAPCALLLHRIGGSSQDEGWVNVIPQLQQKGFAVLAFDFRGHGKSTELKNPKVFWSDPTNNQMVQGYDPAKLKKTICHDDFSARYNPMLVNDIAAARLFLDKKNDAGACNSANLFLIGAEDGATLATMWLQSEYYRYRVTRGPVYPGFNRPPEGRDILFGIWLSMRPRLGDEAAAADDALRYLGRERKLPMAFFYGENDRDSETFAKQSIDESKPDKANRFTAAHPVKGTDSAGSKLLAKNFDTVEDVIKQLDDFVSYKRLANWHRKDVRNSTFIWARPVGGVLPAKSAGEESVKPVPVVQLGIYRP